MRFYNTLSRTVEPFTPRSNTISLYVCGITPYDTTHLGHAFTYTVNDILVRYLELRGLKVRYVQNVTDIDDDILRKAKQVGSDWITVGNQWTTHFMQDMISLNVRPPDHYPRATDMIPEIVALVQQLVKKGLAYESAGNVYFDVHSWPEFGKLNRLPYGEMLPIANERGNFPNDPKKRDPLDFVLWQAQAAGEPAWDSPWGMGRPGWHIECSAMSTKLVGETIDFHSGGGDLTFPHHECEIAQVEPLTGKKPFVRIWLHVAMVRYQGEKMSKSLGNLIWVQELLKTCSADSVRVYLAGYHYRQAWEYDESKVKEAEALAAQFRECISLSGGSGKPLDAIPAWAAFTRAMNDDLNTPAALSVLSDLAAQIREAAGVKREVRSAQQALRELGSVFGLRFENPQVEQRVIEGWGRHMQRFAG
jgi:L-cysteine:1D-myo-inositol 2-amino-2-deoxy-alpha-D-glucopyranoside ligase